MKYGMLVVALVVMSCKSTQNTRMTSENRPVGDLLINEASCPEGGNCNYEILNNSSYTIATDGTGAMYPQYSEGDGEVIVISYEKNGPEGTVDGDYKETVQFVVPSFKDTLTLKDEALQDVQLLFNKQCFCRGQAGYYRIEQGTLVLTKDNQGTIGVELSFEVASTSHTIKKVKK